MRRNVIPTSPLRAQQLRSEQRGSYWTPRPAGNPLTVFLLPCLPNLLPPSWLKGRELHNTCSCAFSSRGSLHSGTSGSNGGALALHTEQCPGAFPQSPQHRVMADSCRTPHTLHQCCAKPARGHWRAVGLGQPAALPYICAVAQPSPTQCTISWFADRGWVLVLKDHSDVP